MNVQLLRQIQKAIIKEPLRFMMWGYLDKSRKSPCGTIGCIAGHAVLIDELRISGKTLNAASYIKNRFTFTRLGDLCSNTLGRAKVLLQLNDSEARRLFGLQMWPLKFKHNYPFRDNGNKRCAQVACARIDHFIKTNGRE